MVENTHTLVSDVYSSALIHAFINNTDDFESMSYDIIEQELKAPYFYNDFLESIDHMRVVYICDIEHWTFDEFTNGIVYNKDIIPMLFKCWLYN